MRSARDRAAVRLDLLGQAVGELAHELARDVLHDAAAELRRRPADPQVGLDGDVRAVLDGLQQPS